MSLKGRIDCRPVNPLKSDFDLFIKLVDKSPKLGLGPAPCQLAAAHPNFFHVKLTSHPHEKPMLCVIGRTNFSFFSTHSY